ncbi:MAG: phosphotransferase [Candidatus Omnitrophica bacterium]|nr:phosphotransferase [Candidatus Omnitrophota bacterium]
MILNIIPKFILRRIIAAIVLTAFVATSVISPAVAQTALSLPAAGSQISLSPAFTPTLLTGVKIFPENPFKLEFILNKSPEPRGVQGAPFEPGLVQGDNNDPLSSLRGEGQGEGKQEDIKKEANRLIKYFLASVTVPEKDLWVNLSPVEKNCITTEAFGQTEMGRDLLAQDYILKQITASLLNPDNETGRKFWESIYSKVYLPPNKNTGVGKGRVGGQDFDISTDILSKVWIVPAKAVVYEGKDSAYVVESKLKVLLEEDYNVILRNEVTKNLKKDPSPSQTQGQDDAKLNMQLMRQIIIPALEREVNEGKNFAQLRQIYNSLILATWYKDKVKSSIFGKAYIDQKKTGGINISDKNEKEKIWAQYVEIFKKGAYNNIKEEYDPATQQIIAKKYFSGGAGLNEIKENGAYSKTTDKAKQPKGILDSAMVVKVTLDPAMKSEDAAMPADKIIPMTWQQAVEELRKVPVVRSTAKKWIAVMAFNNKGEVLLRHKVLDDSNLNDWMHKDLITDPEFQRKNEVSVDWVSVVFDYKNGKVGDIIIDAPALSNQRQGHTDGILKFKGLLRDELPQNWQIQPGRDHIQRYKVMLKNDVIRAARLMCDAWQPIDPLIGETNTKALYDVNLGEQERSLKQIAAESLTEDFAMLADAETLEISSGQDLGWELQKFLKINPNLILENKRQGLKYKIQRRLGDAEHLGVYQALRFSEQEPQGKMVALKIYHAPFMYYVEIQEIADFFKAIKDDPQAIEFFAKPTEKLAVSMAQWENYHLLDMDFVEGTPLSHITDKEKRLKIILDFIEKLAHIHRTYKAFHGDLNENNVMVHPDGSPVVIDWDFLRIADDRDSIEQIKFSMKYKDIFSVGSMLLQTFVPSAEVLESPNVFTGDLWQTDVDISATTPTEIKGADGIVPEGILKIIKKAMLCTPSDHYESLDQLLNDLRNELGVAKNTYSNGTSPIFTNKQQIIDFLQQFPFAEGHVHFGSSVPEDTLWELALERTELDWTDINQELNRVFGVTVDIKDILDEARREYAVGKGELINIEKINKLKTEFLSYFTLKITDKVDLRKFSTLYDILGTLTRGPSALVERISKQIALKNYVNGVKVLIQRATLPKGHNEIDVYFKTRDKLYAIKRGFESAEQEVNSKLKSGEVGLQTKLVVTIGRSSNVDVLLMQTKALLRVLADYKDLREFVVGFDVAGEESLKSPTELIPVFDLIDQYNHQRQLKQEEVLAITYHVGEDFKHVSVESSIRNADEVIELGTRGIGHGLVLGLDPQRFLGKTKKEHISERLTQIYYDLKNKKFFKKELAAVGLVIDETVLWEELKAFPDENEYIKKQILPLMEKILTASALDIKSEKKLYARLNKMKQLFRHKTVSTLYETQESIKVLRQRQRFVLNKAIERQVIIEVNPSVNVLIGPIEEYREHPLPNLLRYEYTGAKAEFKGQRPLVSINTDNQTILGIDLIHEYLQMILTFGLTHDDVKQIILNGIKYRLGGFPLKYAEQIRAVFEAMGVSVDIDQAMAVKSRPGQYANFTDFSKRAILGPLPDGKGSSITAQEIIERELPAALYTVKNLIRLRIWMDENGYADRPVVIWQNLSLGEYYPYFTEDIKRHMGVVDYLEEGITKKNIMRLKNARFILIKAKMSSEFANISEEYEKFMYLSSRIKAPIVMIDHSNGIFSKAQIQIKLNEESAKREVLSLGVKDDKDLDKYASLFRQENLFVLLNPNLKPIARDGISSFDDPGGNLVSEVTINSERMKALKALKVLLGYAVENNLKLNDTDEKGGIDLTRDKMNIEVKGAQDSVKFKVDQAMLQQLQNSSGLMPVVVDVHPLTTTIEVYLNN